MLRVRCLSVLLLTGLTSAQPFPSALYDRLEWRSIGPFRGGRVIAVSGIPGDAATYYFGAVGGGVWKTTDAGVVWKPVFDSQPIASIGAIAVAPSDPQTVYVGSGEADMRSQIGFGDGVYKSTDAGQTWRNLGLRDTRQISKIVIDPHDANVVFVAALGHAYGPNAERGIFRSTDGGAHWQHVLDKGPELGAADLAMDPANPRLLFATLWNAHRPPWSQYPPIEGPGSGLYRSTDGGSTWTELKGRGLPASPWHRSGVAVASGGRRVYAVVDAEAVDGKPSGGLFRSDDGGDTWTHASADPRLVSRSWYFSSVTVDPANPDMLYVPNVAIYRSADAGKTFTVFKGQPGGDDYHTLWIDPADPRRMLLGSDQGANVSVDGGATWSSWYNQPTAQMYHVITDHRFPYAVYGAQQDSGSIAVRSLTNHGQIDSRDWFTVGGGEAGYIALDSKDPDIVYTGDTVGSLVRYNLRTGESQNITPWPDPGAGPLANKSTLKFRFPWTAPLVASTIEPGTLYYGAQYLLKTTDGGLHWQPISPDLTGDTRPDKTRADETPTPATARAQGYGVIYAISPSPLRAGLIWVGSDTGLIHVTRDGGKTWTNVTPLSLPDWSRVTQLEASHFDPAVAYASVDRHRMEDYKPYAYRTTDYGKTWTPIVSGLAEPAYVNSIKEDPARQGMLYAATEMGVAVSFDAGGHWQSLQLNLPVCSARDLEVHGDDLVVATHGRGFWILDDASLLRQISPAVSSAAVHLYAPAAAIRLNPEFFPGTPLPPEEPQAKNPPRGAILDFYLRDAPSGEVALEILDAKNALVRRYSSRDPAPPPIGPAAVADFWLSRPAPLTPRAGMNRFVWDLRYPLPAAEIVGADADPSDPPVAGPLAVPGNYQVRLTVDGRSVTQPLNLVMDPRSSATADDLAKQWDLSSAITRAMAQAETAAADLRALREQLARKPGADEAARIAAALTPLLIRMYAALGVAQSADRTPPATAYQLLDQANREMAPLLAAWKTLRESAGLPAIR
jgi:photosystem II stability/assembly factor-like uncharacterized protein